MYNKPQFSLIHKFIDLHKHPGAFNPKYIVIRVRKQKKTLGKVLAEYYERSERPAQSSASSWTTRRRSDGQRRLHSPAFPGSGAE